MTDNEIIKALECCQKVLPNCKECPVEEKQRIMCCDLVKGYAIDLINRQKEEIERLTSGKCVYLSDDETIEYCVEAICPEYKKEAEIKSEARKEFAEKAKEIIDLIVDLMFDDSISKCQLPHCHKPSSIPCENETCIQENKEYWHGKLDNLLIEMESEEK